jgi:hypothetical protein
MIFRDGLGGRFDLGDEEGRKGEFGEAENEF